jgi:aminoglycoside 6-adenylyltransferase
MVFHTYLDLEAAIRAWARCQPLVEVILVVGSRARQDHPADRFSDLDLILFSTQADLYESDQAWLEEIGETWGVVKSKTGLGDVEWLVLFSGGFKADFVLVKVSLTSQSPGEWRTCLAESPYDFVLARGARLLYARADPELQIQLAISESPSPPSLPTNGEFRQQLTRGYLALYQASKMAQRSENFPAQRALQCDFRQVLVTFLAWQAITSARYPVFAGDRHLTEWADLSTLKTFDALLKAAAFTPLHTIPPLLEYFRSLAGEVGDRSGILYPGPEDDPIQAWLRELCLPQDRSLEGK